MAKILQVRLVEGELTVEGGRYVLRVDHEIEETSMPFASHAVAALRYDKFVTQMAKLGDAGEGQLEKPRLGGRRPKAS